MKKKISKFRKSQLELNAKYLAQPKPSAVSFKLSMPAAIINSIEVLLHPCKTC